MLFCLELQISKSLNQFALSLLMSPLERTRGHEQLPGESNCKGPSWATVCSHSHADVATLRFYSSRPVLCGDHDIKMKMMKIRKPPNSAPMFAGLLRIVPGAFDLSWIRHSFGPVIHSAVIFEEYPSGLCSIFDSANKYREGCSQGI
jgi:hypothetical protein